MPYVPKGLVNKKQIESGVRRAQQALGPAVVRIGYSLESDWTGDPSVFFRIVLSDEMAQESKLNEIAQAVRSALMREVNADELGLHSYFNFRSQSEQEQLNDPAWA